MDSKNNIGHSADISFTAELPIPIYNGNNSMDFEKLPKSPTVLFCTNDF